MEAVRPRTPWRSRESVAGFDRRSTAAATTTYAAWWVLCRLVDRPASGLGVGCGAGTDARRRLVGAATSYIFAIATDRTRWKRADQVWLNAQRIDAYAEFAHALRRQIVLSTRIAAERGFHISGWTHPIEIDKGLAALADAEEQRGLAYHRLMLVGDEPTIAAAGDWQTEVWRVELFTRGHYEDQVDWQQTIEALGSRGRAFYEAARLDLGVQDPPPNPRFPERG